MNNTTKRPVRIKKTHSFCIYDHNPGDASVELEDSSNHFNDNDNTNSNTNSKKKKRFEKKFRIQMFGMNEAGKTCSIIVTDVKPFFFIQVPNRWTQIEANEFFRHLKTKVPDYIQPALLNITLGPYKSLYKFEYGPPDQFACIEFANEQAFQKTKQIWSQTSDEGGESVRKIVPYVYQGFGTTIYEGSLPPLLRFFHIHKISPTGWVEIAAPISMGGTTWCDYEFECTTKQLNPQPNKHANIPLVIMSMDIEAGSAHGAFPQPKKTYRQAATQIVDEFLRGRSQFRSAAAIERFFKTAFMAMFQHSQLGGIQCIYPKTPVSKERVLEVVGEMVTSYTQFLQSGDPLNGKAGVDKSHIRSFMKMQMDSVRLLDKAIDAFGLTGGGADGTSKDPSGVDGDTDGATDADTDVEDNNDAEEKIAITEENVNQYDYDEVDAEDEDDDDEDIQLPANYDSRPLFAQFLDSTCTYDHYICNLEFYLQNRFPSPHGDPVTFIGFSVMRWGEKEPYHSACITTGRCDPVPGSELIIVPEEKEVLLEWQRQVTKYRPNVMTGYNTSGFDYEFMFQRSKELGCAEEFLQMSANLAEPSYIKQYKTNEIDIITTPLCIASGEYTLRYYKMPGILQLDMMMFFRKEFNYGSYKLDDVSSENIKDKITKVVYPGNGTTELHTQNITGLHAGDYVHILLPSISVQYYIDSADPHKKSKFQIAEIHPLRSDSGLDKGVKLIIAQEIGKDAQLADMKGLQWGVAKDDMPIPEMQRMMNGTPAERSLIAKYCIQDCNLVQYLLNKTDVLTGYFQMADICKVPISFLLFRGQSIKTFSFMASECLPKRVLIPDLTKKRRGDKFEGAVVLVPKSDMYMDDPVGVGDYSSLYPSIIISQNYAHGSKVWVKDFDIDGNLESEKGEKDNKGNYKYDNLPGFEYLEATFDRFAMRKDPLKPKKKAQKTVIGKRVCRWAQFPDGKKAILPTVLAQLLQKRAATKKEMKEEKDPFMKNILNVRQNGYKITANSLYGQCGGTVSSFYEPDIAASTTSTGRCMIMYARNMAEHLYGNGRRIQTKDEGEVITDAKYVYGDTDSVFFCFHLKDGVTGEPITGKRALKITIELSQELTRMCTMWLKSPMGFAYEKTMFPFVIVTKKRYAGMLYENDIEECYMKIMGLSLKRRDSCDYSKEVQYGMLTHIMNRNYEGAVLDIKRQLKDLAEGKVKMDDLTITSALRGYYVNPQTIPHKVLADRIGARDPGNRPKPGDRIKFIHIAVQAKKGVKLLQGDKIETVEYMTAKKIPIDYDYYVTNQLLKSINQIMALGIRRILSASDRARYDQYVQKLSERCNPMTDANLALFNVAREKFGMELAKKYLFQEVLDDIYRKNNRLAPITSFFKNKGHAVL